LVLRRDRYFLRVTIAGLAYLQYKQLAYFNSENIEGTITSLANTTASSFNNYSIESLGLTNFGIPLAVGMSAGFAIGLMSSRNE
jgi:hypothetical protein